MITLAARVAESAPTTPTKRSRRLTGSGKKPLRSQRSLMTRAKPEFPLRPRSRFTVVAEGFWPTSGVLEDEAALSNSLQRFEFCSSACCC